MITSNKNFDIVEFPNDLCRQILLDSLVDNKDGLSLKLIEQGGEKRNVTIQFSDVYGYRNFDEGDLTEYWKKLGGYPTFVCFSVASSELLDWIKTQSPYKEYPEGVSHFTVVTSNDVIDVLTYGDPKIIISNSKK